MAVQEFSSANQTPVTYGFDELAKVAYQAGFRGNDLVTSVAVAMAESGGRANINNAGMNQGSAAGTVDWGLWQINDRAHGDWFNVDRAYSPLYNAYAAYRVYEQSPSGGKNFDPWVAYQNGAYEQYLPAARAAVEKMDTQSAKAAYEPTVAGRKGYAQQAATGMVQGLADAARLRGRRQLADLKARQKALQDADEVEDSEDLLVQAGKTQDEDSLLSRVNAAVSRIAEQPEAVEAAHEDSEAARFGWDEGALQRPSSMSWGGHDNGRIHRDALYQSEYQQAHWFHEGAGMAFDQMYAAALEDGVELSLTDSYRDYDTQVVLKRRKPTLAATPGRSNHGWGLAIDVRTQEARRWIAENGERFGWYWPEWARPGGSGPDEDWHFEWYGIAGWEG